VKRNVDKEVSIGAILKFYFFCSRQKGPSVELDASYRHRHYIKYSLDFLRPIKTAEAFKAVDWLADLPPTNMAASRPPVE